jgi:hypothetical protein
MIEHIIKRRNGFERKLRPQEPSFRLVSYVKSQNIQALLIRTIFSARVKFFLKDPSH